MFKSDVDDVLGTWWPRQDLQDVIIKDESSWSLDKEVQADRSVHYKDDRYDSISI